MSDDFITRHEFNGLGNRVNTMKEEFAACRARGDAQMESVAKNLNEMRDGQHTLFDKINTMQGKILGGVTVANLIIAVAGIIAVLIVKG